MTATYEAIATTTLGSAQSSVTFSTISGSYTDLVVIFGGSVSSFGNLRLQFNSDTATNYSNTRVGGYGSSAFSDQSSNIAFINIAILDTDIIGNAIAHIQNYSNTTTYKTVISRGNSSAQYVISTAGLWRNTAAINSVTVRSQNGNINTGSVITLYGIKAE